MTEAMEGNGETAVGLNYVYLTVILNNARWALGHESNKHTKELLRKVQRLLSPNDSEGEDYPYERLETHNFSYVELEELTEGVIDEGDEDNARLMVQTVLEELNHTLAAVLDGTADESSVVLASETLNALKQAAFDRVLMKGL